MCTHGCRCNSICMGIFVRRYLDQRDSLTSFGSWQILIDDKIEKKDFSMGMKGYFSMSIINSNCWHWYGKGSIDKDFIFF